jgi:hypothetical protein
VHEGILRLLENTTISDLSRDEPPASPTLALHAPRNFEVMPGI